MGAKIDTAGIEFLEGEPTGSPHERIVRYKGRPVGKPKIPTLTVKPVKQPVRSFEGVSSLRLVGELFKRHYVDLQVLGFWLAIALIVWIKLG